MQMRIGTRGSKLALWQASLVKEKLAEAGIEGEIVEVKTEGDRVQGVALHQMGTVGIFTKALDEALFLKEIDLAVHSAKDMPSSMSEGLSLVALLKREDPRDVLVAFSQEVHLENQSRQWTIGTSSLRRRAFLQHYFKNVTVKDIRGNLDTRLQKLRSGEYDALVLAYAGLKRMGALEHVVQKLNPQTFTPAVGQGAIAVTGRSDDGRMDKVRQILHHEETGFAVTSERAFLRTIEGGCHTPAFGLATLTGQTLSLTAGIAQEDGSYITRKTDEGPVTEAVSLGERVAREVLQSLM